MAGEWKALLAEERAHLVEIERRPGIHDDARVLTRRFNKIPRKHIDDSLEYLATSASVINGDSASTTVVDPKAGRETFSGTWHRLSVQSVMDGSENCSIIQVLAYGDPEAYEVETGLACDTTGTKTYRWDMTREQLDTFVALYSSNEVATTKNITVSQNSKGAFDAVADVSVKDTTGTHLTVEYTYASDASHKVTVTKFWNLLKSDMQVYLDQHSLHVDGRSVNIQVNRNADCTYDLVITVTETDGGLDIDYTVGVNCDHLQSVSMRWDLTEAEALAFVSSYSAKEDGITKTVSVSRNSDNTFNVNAKSTTTSGSEVEVASFGSSEDMSIKYTFKYNLNRVEYDNFLLTYSTREHGRLRQMQTFRNPDCTFNVIMIDRFKDYESKIDFSATFRPNLDSSATVLNVWNLWDEEAVRAYITDNNLDAEVEGVSQTVRVTRNEDGTFDLAAVIDDGRGEEDEITTVVGRSSTELETAVYKFNLTTEQANTFVSLYSEQEEGKNKSVSLQRQPNGLFNAVGREVTSGEIVTIDFTFGRDVDTEGRIIAKWGLEDQAAVDDFVSTLNTQTEGLTRSVQIFRNSDGTYNMIANIGLITNEFQFTYAFERTFDITQTVFHAYNIADHDALIALIGSHATTVERKTSRQVRESRNSDGTWNLTIITQVSGEEEIELRTRINFEGCDAERIELTLYNRTEEEPSPTGPSGDFQLMEKRASQQSDGSVDWAFVYQKKGVKQFTVRERDPGAEAEMVEILLLNRSEDVPPGVEGFVLVMKVVEERGQCLANYRYTFQKEGTEQHVTETRFPGQDAEQKSYTYLNRKEAPSHSAGTDMLTIAKSVRERGGLLADYLFIDIQTKGTLYTVGRRKLPGGELLLQRIYLNVADGDITSSGYWSDVSAEGGTGYVQAVDINERGQGYADIRQTIVFPFGYDGSTIIACQTDLEANSKPAGANHRHTAYRYWWTLYRSVVVTTVREHVPDGPSALLPPSYSLVYPNDGSTSDGTVAFLLTGTIVKEKYTNTQYGFWYKDTTTTVYSNSGLHAFNGGAPLKTPGKPYAAALV